MNPSTSNLDHYPVRWFCSRAQGSLLGCSIFRTKDQSPSYLWYPVSSYWHHFRPQRLIKHVTYDERTKVRVRTVTPTTYPFLADAKHDNHQDIWCATCATIVQVCTQGLPFRGTLQQDMKINYTPEFSEAHSRLACSTTHIIVLQRDSTHIRIICTHVSHTIAFCHQIWIEYG